MNHLKLLSTLIAVVLSCGAYQLSAKIEVTILDKPDIYELAHVEIPESNSTFCVCLPYFEV